MKEAKRTILVKAKIIAEDGGICGGLSNFKDNRVRNLKIKSCYKVQAVVEVDIEIKVLGEYEECISVLKRLNRFLTNQEFNYRCGYCETKTIPAEYEVAKNA